jgi:hypothetical protein
VGRLRPIKWGAPAAKTVRDQNGLSGAQGMFPTDITSGNTALWAAAPWTDWLEQFNAQCRAIWEGFENAGDQHLLRRRWLEFWTKAMDQYLKSPAFLELMQRSLKTMTDLEASRDELVRQFAHQIGIALSTDIHELCDSIRDTDNALQSRLDTIERRLERIDTGPSASAGPL